jgi:hypothetical protein
VIARFRYSLSLKPFRVALLVGALAVALSLVVSRLPRSIEATGTLDQCLGGWPVVQLDGDWRGALPKHVRAYAPQFLPVAQWPPGMSFDEASGELRDSSGSVLFRRGDQVWVKGAVIEVHGDPSPCYYIYNLMIDAIDRPTTPRT